MEGSTGLGNMKGKTCLESKEEGVVLPLMNPWDVQKGNLRGTETDLKLQRQSWWRDSDLGAGR